MRVWTAQAGGGTANYGRALRRLGAAATDGLDGDAERAEGRLAVRSAAALYIVGALLTSTAAWLPHVSSPGGVAAVALVALVCAAVLLVAAGRLGAGLRAAWLADLWGVVLVALLCAASGGSRSPFALIYFFAIGHAAAFQPRLRLAVVWAASVLGFLAPLVYGHGSSGFGADASLGVVLTLITAGVIHFALSRARSQRELLELLIGASSQLERSLDPQRTLRRIASVAVPGLADLCVVELLEREGSLGSTVAACADPEIAERVERVRRDAPLEAGGRHAVASVIQRNEPCVVADLQAAAAGERFDASEEYRQLIAAAGCRSAAVFAIAARGRVHGAISYFHAAGRGSYRPYQLSILSELSARAAIALDNARLYAERARVASTLRRSLMPAALPKIPGLELASFFRPMAAGVEVGGDFFDVFRHGQGCWLVVGDVCGKGAEAAALTGFLRHTTMAYARESASPAEVLLEVNQAMLEQNFAGRFATMLLGHIQPVETGLQLLIASGGHPTALVAHAGGGAEQIGECGTLLGVFADPVIEDTAVTLRSGDVVLLYTDGLPDAHAPAHTVSVQDMLEALGQSCPASSQAAIDTLLGLVGPRENARDDIAILAAVVRPLAAREQHRPGDRSRRLAGEGRERIIPGQAAPVAETDSAR